MLTVHHSSLSRESVILNYDIHKGLKLDVERVIQKFILEAIVGKYTDKQWDWDSKKVMSISKSPHGFK